METIWMVLSGFFVFGFILNSILDVVLVKVKRKQEEMRTVSIYSLYQELKRFNDNYFEEKE